MKVTFILPTCEPNMMFKFLLPSLKNIRSLKDYIEFNICFQPPYTENDIRKTLKIFLKNRIRVNYCYKDYQVVKPYTPLIKMRNDCAMMSPDSDIYSLIDDDMSFESTKYVDYFFEMLNYFETNKLVSVVSFYNQPHENTRENFYSTNAGLFYRGGKYYGFDGLVPEHLTDFNIKINTRKKYQNENLLELFGGNQDKFCAMIRLAGGTIGKCIYNVPVNHKENREIEGKIAHGWSSAVMLEGSVTDFIVKYFNERFIETHFITLFDTKTDKKIYPFKYENGKLKLEYDLYDERGFKRKLTYNNIRRIQRSEVKTKLNDYITLKKLEDLFD